MLIIYLLPCPDTLIEHVSLDEPTRVDLASVISTIAFVPAVEAGPSQALRAIHSVYVDDSRVVHN
jgi:hypothetical protein